MTETLLPEADVSPIESAELDATGKITADDLERRLAVRYRNDASDILFAVRDDAGFRAKRTADAISIGLWPSTGCTLDGYEIKVSRGDWLRELRDGSKSEAFIAYLDRWFIVAPRAVVKDEELPPGWGLIVPVGENGLRVAVPAARNTAPLPLPRGMLVSMVKRASAAKAIKAELDAKYREGVKRGEELSTTRVPYELERLRKVDEKMRAFQEATGINIEHVWDVQAIKTAYAMVKSGGHLDIARRIGYASNSVKKLSEELDRVAREINPNVEAQP